MCKPVQQSKIRLDEMYSPKNTMVNRTPPSGGSGGAMSRMQQQAQMYANTQSQTTSK